MAFRLALLAAFGVALANGVAAVPEKIGADKETKASKLKIGLLVKLLADLPYILGLLLDGVAWILTLVAVHTLPLFIVQPIVAFSVVVTVLIDRLILKRDLKRSAQAAILVIFAGLAMLALTASDERAHPVALAVKWCIVLAPLPLAILGSIFAKVSNKFLSSALAAVSGIAFGGTAITGRMLVFAHPYWHVLLSPVLWSLVAYGLIGILAFTVALQRNHASIVNATMVVFETLVPIAVGIGFLGDRPSHNAWPLVGFGIALALAGSLVVSLGAGETPPALDRPPTRAG